jgi:hypothetical protein
MRTWASGAQTLISTKADKFLGDIACIGAVWFVWAKVEQDRARKSRSFILWKLPDQGVPVSCAKAAGVLRKTLRGDARKSTGSLLL